MWRSLAFVCALCIFADVRLVLGGEGSGGGVINTRLEPVPFTPPAEPFTLDETFQFTETNFTVINDIELFPDDRIVYGGAGRFETLGIAESNGAVENSDSYGALLTNVTSLALDTHDRAIYSVGSGSPGMEAGVQRATSWDDFGWTFRSTARGRGNKVLRLADRDVLAAGSFQITGDTNYYGLVRLDLAGTVDETFAYTNFVDLEIKSAVALADGSVIATYLRTNGNLIQSEAGRWLRDGTRDEAFNGEWAQSFGTNSQVTAMAKVPGTNWVLVALRTEPGGEGGKKFSRFIFIDEAGTWTGGWLAQDPYIEGTVHAIAFEVVNPATATNGGFDRVIAAGEFTMFEDLPCNNMVSIDRENRAAWYFPTNAGPNGPIHDVAVQSDGKVLIAGAFTNVNGIEAKGLARIHGSSATNGATYLYWADSEFRWSEAGLGHNMPELPMRRSGDLSAPLTVFLSCEHPREGELVNVPWAAEFAAGQAEAVAVVGVINNLQRGARERFEILATVTNANVLLTRAKIDFVVLDDETAGTLDPSFQFPTIPGMTLLALQADTKLLFGGYGASLARFNSDGSLDHAFVTNGVPELNLGTYIYGAVPQENGKIYVSGDFSTSAGTYGINHVARLNADGTLDSTFDPRLLRGSSMPGRETVKMLVDKNGEVLLWLSVGREGLFGSVGIIRLNDRGELIGQYQGSTPHGSTSPSAWALSDQGELVTVTSAPNGTFRKYNPSGQLLTNFVAMVPSGPVYDVLVEGNALFLAGNIRYADIGISNLARINFTSGTIETNFNPRINGPVAEIQFYDGKLYISGDFTEVNGQSAIRLARLNLDGSLDESFDAGLGLNRPSGRILFQPDGKLLVTGDFHRVDGVPTSRQVRLHNKQKPGEIRFVSRRVEVSETNQFVTIEVERVGGSFGTLSMTLSTVEGSALAGQQFAATNVTVTFADGEFGRKSVQIPVIVDGIETGTRTFSILLGDSFNATEATVLIHDEQSPLVRATVNVFGGTNEVRDIAVGADGFVYVGGYFTNIGGLSVTNLARLSPSLAPDSAFTLEALPNPSTPPPDSDNPFAPIESLAVRPSGALLYSGAFNSIGTNDWRFLAQVFTDGTYDAPFNSSNRATSALNNPARQLLLEPDEKLLGVVPFAIRRVNTNGTLNGTLQSFTGQILVRHPDGTLYVADNNAVGTLRKLVPGGFPQNMLVVNHRSTSGAFSAGRINALALAADGSLLVGGDFTHLNQTNHSPRLARVFTNGVVDTNFVAEIGMTGLTPRDAVTAIHVLPSGEILVGGKFEYVQGVAQRVVALLSLDGQLRGEFDAQVAGSGIAEFEGAPDGGVIVRGSVTAVNGVEVGDIFKLGFGLPQAPVARFLWPTNGAEVRVTDVPNDIRLHVFDPDGYIETVVLELDGQPIATNSTGNVPFLSFLPPSGEHQLRVIATDATGLTITETVTFSTVTVVMQPTVILQNSAGELVISYEGNRLQHSTDLVNWTDVHTGGGEYRPDTTESQRFFRAAGP